MISKLASAYLILSPDKDILHHISQVDKEPRYLYRPWRKAGDIKRSVLRSYFPDSDRLLDIITIPEGTVMKRTIEIQTNIFVLSGKNPKYRTPYIFRMRREEFSRYVEVGILVPLDGNELLAHEYGII